MSLQQTFRINTPAVVAEIFEDEIVIIHLESGAYYSLDQNGAIIWQWLQQGVGLAEIKNRLGVTYHVGRDEIMHIVPQFIDELVQEQLIVPLGAADDSGNGQSALAPAHSIGVVNSSFTRPVLTKFTDMQDLLLLDPIHDVNSSGWPAKK